MKEENIQRMKELSREDLEKKFISLYDKLQNTQEEKPKIEIPEAFSSENYIDFSNYKTKRRQQYLHKTYTKNPVALNYMLNELLKTRNENLQAYFNNLNKELEKKATENEDLAPE